jgi:VWFA-related protein
VDVTVTGRDDQPLDDLRAEDFVVREDGELQSIATVQFVRVDGEPQPGDDLSLAIRSPEHGAAEAARDDVRLFALFLDDYHITRDPPTTQRLRRALTTWIDTALRPTDVVVIMDPLTPLSALEFTRSKADLLARIRNFEGRRGYFVPPRSVLEEGQLLSRNVRRVRAEVTLSALAALVSRLGSLRERRSTVLFVSEGPPIWFSDGDIEDRVRDVLRAANRSNVTLNTVDPRGLTATRAADILWRLSGETGGRAVVNSNSLERGLALATRDASAYYLVGYAPPREGAGGFRRVEVEVRRRGVKVLARRGYWAPAAEEMTRAPVPELPPEIREAAGVFATLDGRRPAVTWWGVEPGPGGSTTVRLSWQPARARDGPQVAAVMQLIARDGAGELLVERELAPADARGHAGQGARVPVSAAVFDVAPGPVTLEFTLLGADRTVVDRWIETIVVPPFAPGAVAMGTPRLFVARSALEYRALTGEASESVPTPLREFRRTDRVLVEVPRRVDAGGLDVQLLNRTGARLVDLRWPEIGRLELPLASLAAGDYILALRVRGHQAIAQHIGFRIVP